MRSDGPIQAGNIQKFTTHPGLSQNCLFIKTGCYMPDEFRPCTENTDGTIEIVNNGDPGDCAIAYQIKGENYLLWNDHLNTGDGVKLGLIIHFPVEDFPESEILTIKFFTGYVIDETTMAVTDQIEYDVFIYVKKVDWVQMAIIGGVAVASVGVIYFMVTSRKTKHVSHPRGYYD